MTNSKMNALAKMVYGETELVMVDEKTFTIDDAIYVVLTQEERDEAVKDEIEEVLWAFIPSFLSELTEIKESVFEKLAELSEDANEVIEAIINNTCGIEDFIDKAVQADGYGHFLSRYDGEEMELEGELYAYRTE